MLCSACSNIFHGSDPPYDFLHGFPAFRHHPSPYYLAEAADEGCHICLIIWKKLSHEERRELRNTWSSPFIYETSQTLKRLWKKRVDHYSWSPILRASGEYGIRFQFGDSPFWKQILFHLLPVPQDTTPVEVERITKLEIPGLLSTSRIRSSSRAASSRSSIRSDIISSVWTPEIKSMIREWFDTCVKSHSQCRMMNNATEFQPHRILDVSDGGLRLDIDPAGRIGHRWVTLTHRWSLNPSEMPRLTKHNLESMCQQIDPQILTPTFREAVDVARLLNIRYLWIDSLCILQSGPGWEEDWQIESAVMGEIYQKAYLNIQAGQGEKDTALGLFKTSGYRDVAPFKVQVTRCLHRSHKHKKGDPPCKVENLGPFCIVDEDFARDELLNAPVNQRAWVLQERLLSHRIVHFGQQQVFWECRQLVACETFPSGLPDTIPKTITRATTEISPTEFKPMTITKKFSGPIPTPVFEKLTVTKDLRAWWYVATLYSACFLTRQSDKLVAISGIAQIFSKTNPKDQDDDVLPYLRNITPSNSRAELDRRNSIRRDSILFTSMNTDYPPAAAASSEYLAGLWSRQLIPCLLWYVANGRQADGTPCKRIPGEDRAPSWSWASLNGLLFASVFERWPSAQGRYLATIHTAQTTPTYKDNPWGAVSSGSISLTTRIIHETSLSWPEQSDLKISLHTSEIHVALLRKIKLNSASVARIRILRADVKCLIDDVDEFHAWRRRSSGGAALEIALLPLLGLLRRRQTWASDQGYVDEFHEFHGLVVALKSRGGQRVANRLGYFRVRDTEVFEYLYNKSPETDVLLF